VFPVVVQLDQFDGKFPDFVLRPDELNPAMVLAFFNLATV
jgi:hypothetical protein